MPVLAVELAEELHDLVAGLRVEVAGGLVGQDQLRVVDQRAGDGHALLLAAGQLVGQWCAYGRRGPTFASSSARAGRRSPRGVPAYIMRQRHVVAAR